MSPMTLNCGITTKIYNCFQIKTKIKTIKKKKIGLFFMCKTHIRNFWVNIYKRLMRNQFIMSIYYTSSIVNSTLLLPLLNMSLYFLHCGTIRKHQATIMSVYKCSVLLFFWCVSQVKLLSIARVWFGRRSGLFICLILLYFTIRMDLVTCD